MFPLSCARVRAHTGRAWDERTQENLEHKFYFKNVFAHI